MGKKIELEADGTKPELQVKEKPELTEAQTEAINHRKPGSYVIIDGLSVPDPDCSAMQQRIAAEEKKEN